MSIQETIIDIIGDHMNPPEAPGGFSFIGYDKENKKWTCCPYCGKKQFPANDGAKVSGLIWKCKGSNCKRSFEIKII